ncbi:PREDICTED: apolipoprotein L3-like [Elephantulus edwardii]|uniref:apolipoprotein L3-like n=1 Tax=Elephantulus edwardii TaxID=28737 RepID=UPI0003F0D4C7|nr:PREDICTED: apolipoprotein L3-like [Elephantulus edwardii]
MIIYRDLISHDELFSDIYKIREIAGGLTEAEELREALNRVCKDKAMEDEDVSQKERQVVDTFVNEFPEIKEKLENCIRELEALEENSETTCRVFTITNVVTDSVSIFSGLLTIASLLLAPVTAGASLGLMAAGAGLGAAATATSITSSIVDATMSQSTLDRAQETLSNASLNVLRALEQILEEYAVDFYFCVKDAITSWKNFRALRLVRRNARLAANARHFSASGSRLAQDSLEAQRTLRGSVLSMTRSARIKGMASTGFFLLLDVASLVNESMALYEGTKSESAEEIGKMIAKGKRMLRGLTEIYENLQRWTQ